MGKPHSIMEEQCANGFAHVSESALEGVLQKLGADVPNGNGDVCDRKTVLTLAVLKHSKPGWTQRDANRALNSCFLLQNPDAYHDLPVTPDMIADDTAAGREYVGARVEVPEARRRCKYVVDAIKARNSNEGGGVAADNKVLRDKYRAQSTDYNVFYRATAILFWRDFGSGHWGRDQNRSIDLDDLVSLRDATYEDGITPVSPMSAWTWTTGDQHLSNFGAWRNRGGEVVFSVNDFDEAAIYDFHIDVLRIAVSICNHGRSNGFGDGDLREALEAFTFTYVDTVSDRSPAPPPPWRPDPVTDRTPDARDSVSFCRSGIVSHSASPHLFVFRWIG